MEARENDAWSREGRSTFVRATHKAGVIDATQGRLKLEMVRMLNIVSVPVRDLWESALTLAIRGRHPVYDTVFVELAQRLKVPLVTFDRLILKNFPGMAIKCEDF